MDGSFVKWTNHLYKKLKYASLISLGYGQL